MRRLIIVFTVITLIFSVVLPAKAETTAPIADRIKVYYAGQEGGVRQALNLATDFDIVTDPNLAEVFILNGKGADVKIISEKVKAGAGLVLIFGPDFTSLDTHILLGTDISLAIRENPISLVDAEGVQDPIIKNIIWNSAPQIRDRYKVETSEATLKPFVVGFEDGSLIIGKTNLGEGPVFLVTPFLDGYNSPFQEWAYFNYMIYFLVMQATGKAPLSFADYPGSPLPHSRERLVLFILLGGTLIIAATIFLVIRRYSLAHPEELDTLVVNRNEFETRQAKTDWEEVGFHRALGGFMLALMLGLVLFIPLIIYQNLILPVYILPSAQALGIWGRVVQFFNFLWLLLDMGTSAAFIKFFAQYRVHDPRKAIQYAQVFVWWQALSGAVQVALVTALAGSLLPHTVYALYAWSVILHTMIQVPGFFQVMRHSLMAWQRFDYAQILEIGLYLVFPIVTQPILVSLMVAWGRSHPAYGPAMGGLLGLGIAAYAAEALTFLIGLWLYRRLGYNARLLFLAHFDWAVIKEAFRFGVFEMLGSVAWAIGQAVEIVITQTRLVNYTEIWGNWGLAQNFVFAFNVLQSLYNHLMPSISESLFNARRVLSQYYAVMAYKWGGMISAFVGAVLLAVADRFILGASGPEFVRAATFAIPLIIWGAIQYPSWVGDCVQLAANRPYLKATLVTCEQLIRITLAYLLLKRFQINALIIAYFIGLLSKDFIAYYINNKVCFPQRFYFWQSLAAPLLAGAAHYGVLRWTTGLIWKGDQITSVVIFLIGILLSYPLYAFFYGLFGGWDDETLEELHSATKLSSFMRPFAWLFWSATTLGARFSPLHGRFPIDIRKEALTEASSLTQERVSL